MISESEFLLNASVSYLDMRRAFKKKLLIGLVIVFLSVLFFVAYNNRGASRSEEEEYLTLKKRLEECSNVKRPIYIPNLPIIYAVTPTYVRPVQKAELTRLSHTFMLVPNFHWIIVEDSENPTSLVSNLLNRSGISNTHLIAPTPKQWKLQEKDPKWKKPRGVLQRNKALEWLRSNLNADNNKGVVYFADDDNSYSLEVFEEMRTTIGVSIWPVGLVGGLMVEKPVLNVTTGRVVGWNSMWRPERPFPIDMAGFSINLQLLLKHPEAKFSFDVERGFQESEILRHLTTWEKLETKADKCTKVYVWHTRTEAPKLSAEEQLRRKGKKSDEGMEV